MTQKEHEQALELERLLAQAESKLYYNIELEDDDLYHKLAEVNDKLSKGIEKTKDLIEDFKEANRQCLKQ